MLAPYSTVAKTLYFRLEVPGLSPGKDRFFSCEFPTAFRIPDASTLKKEIADVST